MWGRQTEEAVEQPVATQPAVRVRNLVKRFHTRRGTVMALDHVSLDVAPSERLVLLGPSGCGKTTLLRCLAGLEVPDEGEIEINGQTVFSSAKRLVVPPERRGISMVFQSYALWPHMTVFENVAYPLRNRGKPKGEIALRVEAALSTVGCEALIHRHPGQLSGGQQQRVSLARAIVGNDSLVLFDEPLSNVDAKVREQLRIELVAMQKRLGFAAVYVTHDQLEATAVAHRMVVMNTGSIAQAGTPREIYEGPVSRYVAEFTGTANEVPGEIVDRDVRGLTVDTPFGRLRSESAGDHRRGQKVRILFRPEHVQLSLDRAGDVNCWQSTIETCVFLGTQLEHVLRNDERFFVARGTASETFRDDSTVWVHVPARYLRVFAEEG
jgi:iron(III) transport system ATP-binding protein